MSHELLELATRVESAMQQGKALGLSDEATREVINQMRGRFSEIGMRDDWRQIERAITTASLPATPTPPTTAPREDDPS